MIYLKHSANGLVKKAPTGFSWTSLFFGFFVPVFRGDVLWAILSLLVSIVTAGIFWLVFPFLYNKIYIKNLLMKGFIPADDTSGAYIKSKGWVA